MYEQYFGLIELSVTIIGFTVFYIWQRRSLARDIAEREAREKREKDQAKSKSTAASSPSQD